MVLEKFPMDNFFYRKLFYRSYRKTFSIEILLSNHFLEISFAIQSFYMEKFFIGQNFIERFSLEQLGYRKFLPRKVMLS